MRHPIICNDPFHDSREGRPGWSAVLGYQGKGREEGPPVKLASMACGACGPLRAPITPPAPPLVRLAEHLGVPLATLKADLALELSETFASKEEVPK